jgi:hypothetical protein
MLAKIISAGALTLLLSGGALAYEPHNIYAGHSKSAQPQHSLQTQQPPNGLKTQQTQQSLHAQRFACRPAFSLPKWQRANGTCPALNASGSTGNALNSQRGATSQHNIYAGHRNSPTRHAANPAPYGYRCVQ